VPLVFWILLLAVWGPSNLVFVGDLFTLYVALELTFAGVPWSASTAAVRRCARRSALLFALLGSMLYLWGCDALGRTAP
jgi:hypothetical protein